MIIKIKRKFWRLLGLRVILIYIISGLSSLSAVYEISDVSCQSSVFRGSASFVRFDRYGVVSHVIGSLVGCSSITMYL